MAKRIITAMAGLVVFFLVLPAKEVIFAAAVGIICIGAVFEMHRALTKNKILTCIGVILSAYTVWAVYRAEVLGNRAPLLIFPVFAAYFVLSVIFFGKEKAKNIYMLGFITAVYTYFLACLIPLKFRMGAYGAFLPFLFAWITDTGAYFSGRFFGRHKLCPVLSPKKTVEGAVGGAVMCVICSAAYVLILDKCFGKMIFPSANYIIMPVIGLFASVISQFGDLAASAVKREAGVKDYGTLLPGHGGIMDRFDSIILTAPFVYFVMSVFAGGHLNFLF